MQSQKSLWEKVLLPSFPSLKNFLRVDVLVIGGGITGITAAYVLTKAGKKVALIEKGKVGAGATALTTAILTQVVDTSWVKLIKMFGMKKAKQILDSHAEAIDFIEETVSKEKIECEFVRCSNFAYANSEKEKGDMVEENRLAKKLGLFSQYKKDGGLGFKNYGYIEYKNQAKFHPLKYLRGLLLSKTMKDISIYENTEALTIDEKGALTVQTNRGEIKADQVIVATHAPFDKKLLFKKATYDTYMIVGTLPPRAIPVGSYEDNNEPYHYFRIDKTKATSRFLFGGEDHRRDVKVKHTKNFRALEDYVKEIFVGIPYTITAHWYGPIIEPVDGIAFIGPVDNKNILYATGFSGNGMTYSTFSALLLKDIILGRKNPLQAVYNARRIPSLSQLAKKGKDFTKEFFGGAVKNSIKYRKAKNKK